MAFVKIDFGDLQFYERLGSGATGSVYRALWKSRQKIVAVKKLLNSLESEVEVLSTLSHRNIVQFYGAVTEEPNFSIMTEYAEKGCLYDYLFQGEPADFNQVLQWSQQIALGMNYLHCEAPVHVIHRDLKSRNIVLTADLVAKICDFGSSKFHYHTTNMSLVGTFPWMAPEVIQQMPVSASCDIFSYGVVLWEMLTHEIPFKGLEGLQVAWLVVAREERLTIPTGCPEKFADLMTNCWKTIPKERSTFKQILITLEKMIDNCDLQEETDGFIQNKHCWMNEINIKLEELKNTKRVLDDKAKQLFEREKQLEEREKLLVKRQAHKATDMSQHDVTHWTKEEVADWVYKIGTSVDSIGELAQYAELFIENDINGKRLFKLTDEDLLHFRILSVGHRKELLDQIYLLEQENKRLLHFPPLSSSSKLQLRPSSVAAVKTVKLTIIYGNTFRKGPAPSEHKWKMTYDLDGDQEAINCVKEVTFIFSKVIPMATVTVVPPHFRMEKWHKGKNPEDVECITQYHEYVKPQQTKFLIYPTEDCVNEEVTVELELRSMANDTLRETTLVPPTITVEEQTHYKSTIVPPPQPSGATGNKKLQGDWATRDRSIFTPPSQQQLPASRPRSRRGSNASETDGEVSSLQHTWANRVEKTPEKLPIKPQSLAAALEKTHLTSKESSPHRITPPTDKGGQVTPPTLDSRGAVNRRYSYEPSRVRRGDYKRVVSSPNLVSSSQGPGLGRPRSNVFEYGRGGSHNKTPRSSYKGTWYGGGGGREGWSMAQTPTQQQTLLGSTPDFHRPQPPGGTAYYRSQSDTRGIQAMTTREHPFSRSEPANHSAEASGGWTEVKRKSTKPKNHPPSTKGKSNPKDRRQRR